MEETPQKSSTPPIAVPPLSLPQFQAPEPPSHRGRKVLLSLVGIVLLASALGGGYYLYQTKFGNGTARTQPTPSAAGDATKLRADIKSVDTLLKEADVALSVLKTGLDDQAGDLTEQSP